MEVGIICIGQVRILKSKEIKEIAQGHTGSQLNFEENTFA